jgi:hypothetical protein
VGNIKLSLFDHKMNLDVTKSYLDGIKHEKRQEIDLKTDLRD